MQATPRRGSRRKKLSLKAQEALSVEQDSDGSSCRDDVDYEDFQMLKPSGQD